MKSTALIMTVGRSPKRPLCSVDEDNPNAESILSAHEALALGEQIKSGVDPARVIFTRETHTGEDAPVPATPVKIKRGR